MTKLSALIVAHNEEAILDECLRRLAFVDEIVVVLDRCTDGTKDVALKYGAALVEGGWEVEGARRMTGIDACTGPWILEVDADEWIEVPLADEISLVVAADDADFYFTPIHNYVHGHWVRHGWMAALAPDLRGSLFRKGHKTWAMDRVHPGVSFNGVRGPDFTNGLRHNLADDISALVRRFNRNTSNRALDLVERDVLGRTRTMVRKSFSRFWKCYVSRKGYKEGGVGLLISILSALYPLVAHLKAVEIKHRKKPE
jgi:glycosyltransferase involved in cell wall biosynthesis